MYKHANILGYNGSLYIEIHVDGVYRRLECYLPSSTGTYNEPIEETFHRMAERIKNKTLVPGYADGVRYQVKDGKMVPMKKEKA